MQTTTTAWDDGEITINHNSDWSGRAIVTSTIDGSRIRVEIDGRALVAGRWPTTTDVPAYVVARVVALACTTRMAREIVGHMERAVDRIIDETIGGT